jgi:hypothetical protein
MAKFIGTVQEFHHFIGPKLRNAVNGITRKHRMQRHGVCETCESMSVLQSAHVHGRGRREIIEEELKQFLDEKGMVSGTIEEIESRILMAHQPIEHTFKFLCQACHVRYDSKSFQPKNSQGPQMQPTLIDGDFPKLSRIRLWGRRPQQMNHKIVRAFLQLERNGEVEYSNLRRHCTEILHISGFDAHYASMRTDAGNAHGKVFFNDGSKVRMWDRVRKEVGVHFGET